MLRRKRAKELDHNNAWHIIKIDIKGITVTKGELQISYEANRPKVDYISFV